MFEFLSADFELRLRVIRFFLGLSLFYELHFVGHSPALKVGLSALTAEFDSEWPIVVVAQLTPASARLVGLFFPEFLVLADSVALTQAHITIRPMSSIEKRLEAFRKLPLRAQLALISSTRVTPVLSQNQEYLDALEQVHAECLQQATPQQKAAYEQAQSSLAGN